MSRGGAERGVPVRCGCGLRGADHAPATLIECGAMMLLLKRLTMLAMIVVATLGAAEPALAGLGQPSPWQLGLQQSATPVMDNIIWFHDFLLYIITGIAAFVLALLIVVMLRVDDHSDHDPDVHCSALIQAPVPSAQRAAGRSHREGDRQTVVLELQLPGQRRLRIRFPDAQRGRAQGGPTAASRGGQ